MRNLSKTFGKLTIPLLLLLAISFSAQSAQAKYGGGTGEPNDPYLIYDAKQMNAIGADSNDWDKHFKLMSDVDLSRYAGTEFNIIGTGYLEVPIIGLPYLVSIPFTGTFDGNGFEISNFNYSCTDTGFIYCIGLFGVVDGENAQIKKLVLKDVDIYVDPGDRIGSLIGILVNGTVIDCYTQGGSVSGDYRVGGLVGQSADNVSICNCYTNVNVSGHADIGGLVGDTYYGIISSCYSAGNITGTGYFVGGLVGGNYYGSITNSYSTGDVYGISWRGGLVGENRGPVSNCYATGSVPGIGGDGLIGHGSGTVSNSFWDVNTSGLDYSDGGVGKTTAEMQTMSTFTDAGWDFVGETINGPNDIWDICEGTNYPKFVWQIPIGDFVCPDGVNFFDYSFFASQWDEDNCGASNDCDGRDFDLLGSVDIKDLRIFADNWLAGF
ncbi:MAG: GLUG motif-containing protein [Sedimentisphaerales bacterium]